MRVIECNMCGETLSAANDEELIASLRGHLDSDHSDLSVSDEAIAELVSTQAYEATDS